MRIELDPPVGAGPIRLGMTREQAGVALRELGEPVPFTRGGTGPVGWVVHRPAATFVYIDADGCVEAIEFANPARGQPAEDQVIFDELDVFGTLVDDVLAGLRLRGVRLEGSEGGWSWTAPDLLLAFWRDGEPFGADDLPLYFESAMVARPGYYG